MNKWIKYKSGVLQIELKLDANLLWKNFFASKLKY
jgi:hypothetical protein